jgi:hypothetical protein
MFASLKRTAKMLRGQTAAEREAAYLNGAVDRFDLEARERDVDRGLFRRGGLGY